VFVVIGPFNPHILKPESLAAYRELQAAIASRLKERGVGCHVAPDLPSDEYGDSSHPLAAGYRRAAEALYHDDTFRAWRSGTETQPD
jgi:hypothetical protein